MPHWNWIACWPSVSRPLRHRMFTCCIHGHPQDLLRSAKSIFVFPLRQEGNLTWVINCVFGAFHKGIRMTVSDLFTKSGLTLHGPVPWKTLIPKEDNSGSSPGVYVVARMQAAALDCKECALTLRNPLDPCFNLEYEKGRWLPNEPISQVDHPMRAVRWSRSCKPICGSIGHPQLIRYLSKRK